MSDRNRRKFLVEVGEGMLAALVGPALAAEMGLASRALGDEPARKGAHEELERLVALLQDTPVPKLVPALVEQIGKGVTLHQLVAAGALCNARIFAGHNYDGYHTFMALAPSFHMAQQLPEKERALPVIKVLHRNSRTMGSGPGEHPNRLPPLEPALLSGDQPVGKLLLEASRNHRIEEGERLFLAAAKSSLSDGYNELLPLIHDDLNVHRVVLAWRSWETIDFTGQEHARTLLRQSIHFCCEKADRSNRSVSTILPQLMDRFKLMDRALGTKEADDAWVDRLSQTIYAESREKAAEAVAAALGEGFAPEVVGEAMSLACARLLLGDPGREKSQNPVKPDGSVHGDSVGVHASDSANAWRHIARVSNARNTHASLIAGAYHTAGQTGRQQKELYPQAADLEQVREKDPAALLRLAEEAIRAKDQRRVCAVVQRYGQEKGDAKDLFAVLLRFAVSEDGALHAEKYYRTVTEEFATVRPAFRWRHLIALARVTASEHGRPAPGVEEARKMLG
jgi:hypothetical protein